MKFLNLQYVHVFPCNNTGGSGESNAGAIVGGVIGGIIVLIIIVIIIVVLCKLFINQNKGLILLIFRVTMLCT